MRWAPARTIDAPIMATVHDQPYSMPWMREAPRIPEEALRTPVVMDQTIASTMQAAKIGHAAVAGTRRAGMAERYRTPKPTAHAAAHTASRTT